MIFTYLANSGIFCDQAKKV